MPERVLRPRSVYLPADLWEAIRRDWHEASLVAGNDRLAQNAHLADLIERGLASAHDQRQQSSMAK